MRVHGIDLLQAWRVAFWALIIMAALATAARAIIG